MAVFLFVLRICVCAYERIPHPIIDLNFFSPNNRDVVHLILWALSLCVGELGGAKLGGVRLAVELA